MHLQEIQYLTLVKVTRNVDKYPLHYVIYLATKFKVHTSNGLGGRSHGRTDRRTDRRMNKRTTDRLWYEINIPFFLKKKAGINISNKFDFWSVNEIMNTAGHVRPINVKPEGFHLL